MRTLIERLCSSECAGRRAGTSEGRAARSIVLAALRDAGLDPFEQPVPACGGANVLAKIEGDVDRFVLVGAHFDHLGRSGNQIYWGADDNAAAVAILVETARALANERHGRGVIIAAFDGEEPPFFSTNAMGSQAYVRAMRDPIDFMVCMDLVGHRFGPEGVPDEVGKSLFVLGAERSTGTLDLVSSLKHAEQGLVVRAVDAEIVPPLSDYEPFWREQIPFLFLTAGRSRVYHTPEDTPEKLDYQKIEATTRWLTRFVRWTRARETPRFDDTARADRATLDELAEVVRSLSTITAEAALALQVVESLRAACDRNGRLPHARREQMSSLAAMLEARLK
jgi:Zn-dependent M28 family amino/carboxypeptidase